MPSLRAGPAVARLVCILLLFAERRVRFRTRSPTARRPAWGTTVCTARPEPPGVVGAVVQLWGRLRGSNFRSALDSCLPLDQAVYVEFTRLGRESGCRQDIMILVQP